MKRSCPGEEEGAIESPRQSGSEHLAGYHVWLSPEYLFIRVIEELWMGPIPFSRTTGDALLFRGFQHSASDFALSSSVFKHAFCQCHLSARILRPVNLKSVTGSKTPPGTRLERPPSVTKLPTPYYWVPTPTSLSQVEHKPKPGWWYLFLSVGSSRTSASPSSPPKPIPTAAGSRSYVKLQ